MDRRSFLDRLARLAGGTAAASAVLPMLEYNFALAQVVPEGDPRITTQAIKFPVGSTEIAGYLVTPRAGGKRPTVIVIHENRGLNPHIKDITRRVATDGFVALGVDYLSLVGGTPDPYDDDKAREAFGKVTPDMAVPVSRAALAYLKSHASSTGKVGAVGFCWGGGAVNNLAVADPTLDGGVPFYGRQPPADLVAEIRAPLMLHYAGNDAGINAGIAAYEAALKANGKTYELFMYEGVEHAFNNDTAGARYNKAAADLAWGRTIAFFKKHLGNPGGA
jgi:carboxymethylenebutenolidase